MLTDFTSQSILLSQEDGLMLETVDLGAKLSKEEFKQSQDALDLELGQLQRELRGAGIPVLILFEGWDAAGKGTVLSRLLQPLDPRGFKVHKMGPATPEERLHPPMRRFWLHLPPDGAIGIFDRSWYRQVLDDLIEEDLSNSKLQAAYERIRVIERQLADNGLVIVKFFLHISKKEQGKRFDKLGKDPAFAWKVGPVERRRHKQYKKYYEATEDMLRETSTACAPWTLVPATDERFACVRVAETLAAAFQTALARKPAPSAAPKPPKRRTSPLDRADLTHSLTEEEYDDVLPQRQEELRRLQHLCYVERIPLIVVYEGWDAAGKGGNIRRLVRNLDPRGYEVVPIAAPEGEERKHHYLWRFWRAIPKGGHFAVFDRSWYGRVLVERIEGFATPDEWTRAYREINEFEEQLIEYGAVVVKFWLHISKEEQLARFKARQQNLEKQWKITEDDWRNRKRWNHYWDAVSDMIERTSTAKAPWTVIEANDKLYARAKTLEVVINRLDEALKTAR